jgi:drebrin-like protein
VAKVLHGYHVQITARSDADLAPEVVIQKVADASGAKYTAGGSAPVTSAAAPPVAKKPVFTPRTTGGVPGAFNPLVAARTRKQDNVDDDGWGADAPPVTRSQLEKVAPAYKPTKVNIADLMKNKDESRSSDTSGRGSDDVVGGGYQPVGKVDIAALRAKANYSTDDRPTQVKGAYEPVGKVDIAAIRARSQRPVEEPEETPAAPRSLADRTAAFTQSERLTELPKPKVAKKFGGSTFTGTKAPTPGGLGFGGPTAPTAAPVGTASRTFADQGGKTPAQIWAEKKAKQGGTAGSTVSPPVTSPLAAQTSGGEWKSGYAGKSWATVQTTNFGRGGVEKHATGATEASDAEAPVSPAGGVGALRDRFKDAAPMGTMAPGSRGVPPPPTEEHEAPPPPPASSRPSGGFALPGLPSRPAAQEEEEEEEAADDREPSPVRVAVPVPRGPEPDLEPPVERLPPRPIPVPEELPREEELPDEEEAHDPRAAAVAVAEESVGHVAEAHAQSSGGKRALVQYDYEKAEDNEIELREGEYVTNIEMVDEDWWMGTNAQGESGLFPSNYVELVEDGADDGSAVHAAPPPPAPAAVPEPEPAPAAGGGATATALFDYEAAEDNGESSLYVNRNT